MHNTRMSEVVMKVDVREVLPEFRDIDPPTQPPGAEKHMKLGECGKWMMEWPKTQIRLGDVLHGVRRTGGATSRPRPPGVRPPSRRPQKAVADEPAPQAAVATTQTEPPVAATTGQVVQVCNLRPQPPETTGLDAADHLRAVLDHGGRVDTFLYERGGALPADEARIRGWGVRPVGATLSGRSGLVHDPARLAPALADLLQSDQTRG